MTREQPYHEENQTMQYRIWIKRNLGWQELPRRYAWDHARQLALEWIAAGYPAIVI